MATGLFPAALGLSGRGFRHRFENPTGLVIRPEPRGTGLRLRGRVLEFRASLARHQRPTHWSPRTPGWRFGQRARQST